jgi:uncharacterized secreted protein with C-terminal beta-propeller domain
MGRLAGGPVTSLWRRPGRPATDIHAFSLSGLSTNYLGSGTVPGLVKDQWAFSDYDGYLRVATTRGQPWRPRDNAVTILQAQRGRLVQIGQVVGLGRTETIRAVRWFGPSAVVVTFRQTDPLYTLDLSSPIHPQVAAELKMPGFSAYLHPIGDGLLLGVGQGATSGGRLTGVKFSTYDVSRIDDPSRLDDVRPEQLAEAYSPVEDDSRVFTYLPGKRLALVPVSSWRDGSAHLAEVRVDDEGRVAMLGEQRLPGPAEQVRALPLSGERVAVVAGGQVQQVM